MKTRSSCFSHAYGCLPARACVHACLCVPFLLACSLFAISCLSLFLFLPHSSFPSISLHRFNYFSLLFFVVPLPLCFFTVFVYVFVSCSLLPLSCSLVVLRLFNFFSVPFPFFNSYFLFMYCLFPLLVFPFPFLFMHRFSYLSSFPFFPFPFSLLFPFVFFVLRSRGQRHSRARGAHERSGAHQCSGAH